MTGLSRRHLLRQERAASLEAPQCLRRSGCIGGVVPRQKKTEDKSLAFPNVISAHVQGGVAAYEEFLWNNSSIKGI
jgi:hypothetical protein